MGLYEHHNRIKNKSNHIIYDGQEHYPFYFVKLMLIKAVSKNIVRSKYQYCSCNNYKHGEKAVQNCKNTVKPVFSFFITAYSVSHYVFYVGAAQSE